METVTNMTTNQSGTRERLASAIWQAERTESTGTHDSGNLPDTPAFVYDQGIITLYMVTTGAMAGLPEDAIYRIRSQWAGDDLYIFPPLGNQWQLFASWQHDQFFMTGGGKRKWFSRASPGGLAPGSQGLLLPGRPLWHYPFLDPGTIPLPKSER